MHIDKNKTYVFFSKSNTIRHYILAYKVVERPQELNNSYGEKKFLTLSHFKVF